MLGNLMNGVRNGVFGRVLRGVLMSAGVVVALAITTGASCSSGGGKTSVDVPLAYKPRDADPTPTVRIPNSSQIKIIVETATDKRDEADKRVIGKNIENSNSPLPVIAVGITPAEHFSNILRKQVRDAGLTVTTDMAVATRMLNPEIVGLELREDNRYYGEVRVNFKLSDPTGKELWTGSYSGEGKNFGSSKSAENYNETLSDAIKNATNKMLADPAFKEALSAEPR